MKKQFWLVGIWGIFLLFLIQLAGTLVESIYILDLMNTSLDEKALGVLFFFTPVLLFFYRPKRPSLTAWILFGILFLARSATPYLTTLGRMLSSGIGTGAVLALFPLLMTARIKEEPRRPASAWLSAGLALAVGLSVLLRTVNYGLDYSLVPQGGWTGWILGAVLGYLWILLDWKGLDHGRSPARSIALPVLGIFLVIALAWFAFSAPSVISRWTESDYRWLVTAVSALSLAWVGFALDKPKWIGGITPPWLLAWNLLFTLSLVLTILVHRVPFPLAPDSPAVVIGAPTWIQTLPLAALLLSFPVIYIDLSILSERVQKADPNFRDLIPGILLGSLVLVLLVFSQIFTNVWGYVQPVSPWFRNKFWLPYAMMAGLLMFIVGWNRRKSDRGHSQGISGFSWGRWIFLAILFLFTFTSAVLTTRIKSFQPGGDSMLVMTYNIQQANDHSGERSVEEQLALIREVDPDILALQESDASRVSLNNNDFVRYFAGKLGYYSYFGPTTVTGTYGTAILSKYPLMNTRSVFTYSSQDEIGTAEAEIEVGGKLFTIFNVHPAGSDTAMRVFAESVLKRSEDISYFIVLGDFNLRDDEEAYQLIDDVYTNAWVSTYPSKISPDGIDMSGDNRIDHIFFSTNLEVRDPVYVLPPESATDHPVHWAEIVWER